MPVDIKKETKNTLKDIAENSNVHSLSHIVRTEYLFVRIMWVFAVITATICCLILISLSIIQYYEYNVVTDYKISYQASSNYPTITICNTNPFVTKKAYDFVNNYAVLNNLTYEEYLKTFEDDDELLYVSAVNHAATNFTDEQKKEMGYSLNSTILDCFFGSAYECGENDFSWYYSPKYGNCYRFNSGKNMTGGDIDIKRSFGPGSDFGLKLTLFVGVEDDPKNEKFLDPGIFTRSQGFKNFF
jgi:hypothetical protein